TSDWRAAGFVAGARPTGMLTRPKLMDPFQVVRMGTEKSTGRSLFALPARVPAAGFRGGGREQGASEDPARADVRRRVPARVEAGDLHDVAGVRRLDELAAADVQADVAEAVEEDDVAGRELVARDGDAVVPHRVRRMRQRHADLRVRPHHEPRAVEPAGSRAAPHVRRVQLREGIRHDVAVRRRRRDDGVRLRTDRGDADDGRRRAGVARLLQLLQAKLRLARHLQLARVLRGDEPVDLALQRAVEALLLPDLRLDLVLRRRALRDDPALRRLLLREARTAALHDRLELLHLAEHVRVQLADALRAVDAGNHVVEAARAEDHLERRGLVGHVERREPLRYQPLAGRE